MKKLLKQGILVAVEGIDGSGKSTLAKNLANRLSEEYASVLLTKEPGDTPLGIHLRKLLQTQDVAIYPKAEFLLFAADRANHFEFVVLPALAQKTIVISDRMGDSSVVYQGYARGLDIDTIKTINAWAMNNREADIVFYIRLTAEQAMQRLCQRNVPLTAFEKEGADYVQKLIEGFDEIVSKRHNGTILDGAQTPEQLTNQAVEKVNRWIQQHKI